MENVYTVTVTKDNEIEILKAIVDLYVTSVSLRKGERKLRPKAITVLSYYVKFGYSKATKKLIAESLGIDLPNINVVNGELHNKGFLNTDTNNFHVKKLNNELNTLKEYINNESDNKLFLFNLIKKQ